MKKDIEIPEVEDVQVAAILEKNEAFRSQDWNAYLINDSNTILEIVLVVTRGYDESRTTATMRHKLEALPPKSFAKVEFLQDEVLKLNNEFSISFFVDGKMFHKKFIFGKNSINERDLEEIPLMGKKGILAK